MEELNDVVVFDDVGFTVEIPVVVVGRDGVEVDTEKVGVDTLMVIVDADVGNIVGSE